MLGLLGARGPGLLPQQAPRRTGGLPVFAWTYLSGALPTSLQLQSTPSALAASHAPRLPAHPPLQLAQIHLALYRVRRAEWVQVRPGEWCRCRLGVVWMQAWRAVRVQVGLEVLVQVETRRIAGWGGVRVCCTGLAAGAAQRQLGSRPPCLLTPTTFRPHAYLRSDCRRLRSHPWPLIYNPWALLPPAGGGCRHRLPGPRAAAVHGAGISEAGLGWHCCCCCWLI